MNQGNPQRPPLNSHSRHTTPNIVRRIPYRSTDRYTRLRSRRLRYPLRQLNLALVGCITLTLVSGFIGLFLAIYLLLPVRTNILLLGIDYADPGSVASRSDTIMLTTFIPLKPYIGVLSIPRDLWVSIPGVGENRINTAHFYAEIQQPGSGPYATMQTIRLNFGVDVNYYMRIQFRGFHDVIETLGGVDIELSKPMAGYEPGQYHLTGNKALAFVRNRQGTDDFFRMQQGQFMLKAVFKTMIKPANWLRLPKVAQAFISSVDTNIPSWLWPRLIVALMHAGPGGIDDRIITRDMVAPFTTPEGAMVLAPQWELINPVIEEIFGQ
jgi:LCP family protein required for cell wall assembly